ncbi:carbamate kinase [Candidatus Frackibacter sp. WG12]|uniref:carbamate kinase n=1 Tax=unclassified Candidatus Frackibacter TaxID=2648818 RepID=UPI00079174A2|nr:MULTISPECIES: carbamate kinase [unclassified Candidatus Frackibacter]KXS45276.1 MAG: carbamate kinase [Candidatus Frackibacter sp. T328-2]SDC79071.1 carbamate kinase [Candidatus Frackibacter sp. WG11]SEM91830.1 carbamate kinase [Candidatus Frackibacter sp. WG12]
MTKRIAVALGGNAILQAGQEGTAQEQLTNVRNACEQIANLIENGYEVVVSHGNGPQVGSLLIQNEAASDEVPPMPLEICGAQTQGQIGYMMQQSLGNVFRKLGINKNVLTTVTQVVVEKDDEAFDNPTKPVGPFYSEAEAKRAMDEKDEVWIEDSGRGWRKVVPSPVPQKIVETEAIKELIANDNVIIASGGGGIPVTEDKNGQLTGVEAVIDKDLATRKLAEEVDADILMILTDVPNVAINFGTPDQKNLGTLTVEEMEEYKAEGHFGTGSMGPKVQAALDFVNNGGERAIITSLDQALEAIENGLGTQVHGDEVEETNMIA